MLAWAIPPATVALLIALRFWLLHHPSERRHKEHFDGVVYSVGHASVCERRYDDPPRATVIAMHGFLEDARYFTDHYSDPGIQLVLLVSGDYHVAFGDAPYPSPEWAKPPSSPHGTIAYDAEVLIQAMKHLPKSRKLRLHGHSRGGAVILEAARLRPDLFADAEVVLEAPVLPRGELYSEISPVMLWMLPLVVPVWRKRPLSRFTIRAYGALDNARKRHMVESHPFHPKNVAVMLENIVDLQRWMRERDPSLFANLRRGVILIPSKDKVLERKAMLESAKQAQSLQTVELEGCSHFVVFDRPDSIPPL